MRKGEWWNTFMPQRDPGTRAGSWPSGGPAVPSSMAFPGEQFADETHDRLSMAGKLRAQILRFARRKTPHVDKKAYRSQR